MNARTSNILRIIIILLLLFIIFSSLEYLNYKSTPVFIAAAMVILLSAVGVIYLLYKIFTNKINQS
jgi:hypothetical protein